MATPAIEIENVSKLYKLGYYGADTFRDEVVNFFRRIAGKPPVNALVDGQGTNKLDSVDNTDLVWALKDINLTINQGDIVGIIGKNGAGKSTLLKILSKITTPTTGQIKINGRMASLLEVGTGMNPELTGRENIFLNGAILGMTKREIKSKIDDIIDFSGIAKYADTPIKRYSSGMRVRLGFAISAFLEPEILVVDEVLAVGDAEFQKRAIGKMQDISKGQGRTVLFVSHNMASMRALCTTGVLLKHGTINKIGQIDEIVDSYLEENTSKHNNEKFNFNSTEREKLNTRITDFNICNFSNNNLIYANDIIGFSFNIFSAKEILFTLRVTLFDEKENRILAFDSWNNGSLFKSKENQEIKITCKLDEPLNIKPGTYQINISIKDRQKITLDHIVNVSQLKIEETDFYKKGFVSISDMPLCFRKNNWIYE